MNSLGTAGDRLGGKMPVLNAALLWVPEEAA